MFGPKRWVIAAIAFQALAAPAWAQQSMRFEPIPAESARALERQIEQEATRARREQERRALDAPVPPDVPDEPDAPIRADVDHAGDVVRIGSDIHILPGQVVDGDVFALQGDIRVDGHVKGNVAATGGDVTLGPQARVDGDVMSIGGQLEEEPGAKVGGQRVTALRGRHGRIRHMGSDPADVEDRMERYVGRTSFALSWLLVSVLLAWLLSRFAPRRTGVALSTLKSEPGLSLLFGLGMVLLLVPSVVAMALVVAILCITIIGIPLALGVIIAYVGLLALLAIWGHVVGAIPIGEQVARRMGGEPPSLVRSAVIGALVLAGVRFVAEIFHFLPLFGWFANLLWVIAFMAGIVATLIGAGALLRSKFGQGVGAAWWPPFRAARPAPVSAEAVPPAPGTPPPPSPPSPPVEPSPAA